ncbi:thiamine phosphate synthase [Kriegella aquimaris]|uniref:Thiamine-phosphate synthase n=1 Tax=Kriegella aquimaris TaxID=192904 RepID=A0A1G9TEB3_9FLAO|nr:thiamine phosphate synthase [Kriegella aquimaris]SDM45908.1 thiamine-phosphate diphosphorylase [Kriegella aquimaris]
MTSLAFPYPLYLVISERDCKHQSFLEVAEAAIRGGVDLIQLREKDCPDEMYFLKAERLKELTDKYDIPLIINDNLRVAMEVKAFGIHVGTTDIPPSTIRKAWKGCKSLGYSLEALDQLDTEETQISDWLGVSPVFKTQTKEDTLTEWGLEGIRNIREKISKPLIAIGNMNIDNIAAVLEAGADSIAVVSAICSAKNPEKAAFELKNEILKTI